jgi:hypothetical protein
MQLLSEEIFDFSRGEMTQQKIKELKSSLNRFDVVNLHLFQLQTGPSAFQINIHPIRIDYFR